jgi:formate-dependent nitrite reductase membrane component NrfD
MNVMPVLASDTVGPIVVLLFLGPIGLGLFFLIYLAIKRSGGRRRRSGLIVALIPTIIGALILFFLLTVRGGAPRFFYVAAALPLLVGIKMLQVWSRPDEQ